jgi:hypothetical protein
MPTLPLFIAGYDPSLSRAIICFTFMVLEKYQNFAVLVRNVGYNGLMAIFLTATTKPAIGYRLERFSWVGVGRLASCWARKLLVLCS